MDNKTIELFNMVCGPALVFLFVTLAIFFIVRLIRSALQDYKQNQDPEIYSAVSHDAKKNEAVINEAAAHVNQRRSGHERGGLISLFIKREPVTFLAQLNLKTIRESRTKVETIDKDKK